MRIISLLTVLWPAVFYYSVAAAGLLQGTCYALVSGMAVLMIYPLGYEDMKLSMIMTSLCAVLMLALPPLSMRLGHSCELTVIAALSMLVAYDCMRARTKLLSVKMLFRMDTVWCSIEDYARKFYEIALMTVCAIMLAMGRLGAGEGAYAILCLSMLFLYIIMYKRAWSGRTMFLGQRKEASVMEIIRGNMRSVPVAEAGDEYMSVLYAKVMDYMETCRPFLDPDFSLEDMSRDLFSNKVYLSRAINYYSGRNFKQFVNYYRVKYSIEMMRSRRNGRVIEMALKSGFHSIVTYNMAFKLNTGKTPGEYFREMEESGK